jgi:hypothetical protein
VYTYASGPCTPKVSAEIHQRIPQIMLANGRCTSIFRSYGFGELVEYVKIPLVSNLSYDSIFLKQIVGDIGTYRLSLAIKLDLEVFSVST